MTSSSQSSDNPSSSKHPNLSLSAREEKDDDFINKLSYPLLCRILSFLVTRNDVATSVLCKIWISLWTWVLNVEFDDHDVTKCGRIRAFEATMDNFFASRVTDCCIYSFHLELGESPNPSCYETWISDAIKREIQELDPDLITNDFGGFEVPRIIFDCRTLVVLKLAGNGFTMKVPSSVHLLVLKVLHLLCVRYEGHQSIRNLLAGCLVLEELFVKRGDFDETLDYEITVPSLRSLTLEFMYTDIIDGDDEMTRINKVHLKNLCSLVEAKLDIYPFLDLGPEAYMDSVDVLRAIHNVKVLHLSRSTIEAFQYDPCGCENFPAFDNLVRLKLDGFCCFGGVIQKLLCNSPVLKHLTLGRRIFKNCDCEDCEQWMQQSDVPKCLSFHLKTVCFQQEFSWLEDDIEFVGYILGNSLVLEKMTFNFYSSEKLTVKQKIEKFKKGSQKCQLEFA